MNLSGIGMEFSLSIRYVVTGIEIYRAYAGLEIDSEKVKTNRYSIFC